jgi:hypothetical protein
MADMPKLEMNLSLIDADKVLAEMYELRDEIRRHYMLAAMFWGFGGAAWAFAAMKWLWL